MFYNIVDAKVCAAYNKVGYESEWYAESNVRYKIKRYTWYCFFDQDCCFGSCCSRDYDNDDGLYTYTSNTTPYAAIVGITVGVAFGVFLCIACWINFCKSDGNTNLARGVTYTANDTVVIRQRPQGDTESPLLPPLSDRQNTPQCSPSRVDGNSTVDRNVHSNQGNPEMNSSPGGHFTHTTELIEPPPSYEYVMSHDFPITTSENSHSQND
ncbi:uncharacterized protein LOC125653267 isoform X2 [Ostrea edulis]|uniref:uncharacterized protein LOC125653267 isoform X2 n=1 Tax=Ostrea edulis TaxID=37623 RepID=UPI0024AF0195|nr:uncharacterized protein LOC125653267 isoform X2 [Ostrea edulis]